MSNANRWNEKPACCPDCGAPVGRQLNNLSNCTTCTWNGEHTNAEAAALKRYGKPAAHVHWDITQTKDGFWIARENLRGLEVQATSWEEMQRLCREATQSTNPQKEGTP